MKRTFVWAAAATFSLAASLGCPAKDDGTETPAADDGDEEEDESEGGIEEEMPDDDDDDDDDDDEPDDDDDDDDDDEPGGSTGAGGTGPTFIEMPDGGGVANECDQWEQDCPEGEKCMPWANDGGSAWNATRCVEVVANPGQVGDDCEVMGSGVSGLDDCDVGAMCYYVDPETNIGTCVGMCGGGPENPQCDIGFLCSISNNGVLTLCRRECDPLLQDCQGSAACLPAAGADGFVCIVDASGEGGAPGEPCEFLNSCDPGSWCGPADGVPGCVGAAGCCTEFCDVNAEMPNEVCSLGQGSECVAWFEEGEAPPDLTHVGGCLLPE